MVKHLHEKQPSLSGLKQHKSVTKPKSITVPYSFRNDNFSFLSSVIFSCFTITNIRNFYDDKVAVKNVPSVGPRHGIELHLEFNVILYYYDPVYNLLYDVNILDFSNVIKFFLRFRTDIYMLCYLVQCFIDIYFYISHILGNINMIFHL